MADSAMGLNGRTHTNGSASYAEKFSIADHFIGGNKLENAPASKVKDFVAQNDGHTVITNVSSLLLPKTQSCIAESSPFAAPVLCAGPRQIYAPPLQILAVTQIGATPGS